MSPLSDKQKVHTQSSNGVGHSATNQTSLGLNNNYADQWIDFLRKRNALLNVLWPLFLTIAICASIAAFYFQQSAVTDKVSVKMLALQVDELDHEKGLLLAEFRSEQEKNKSYLEQVSQLKKQLDTNGSLSKASVEKEVLSAQLISNLESKIALLNTENKALVEALEENKALVELHKGSLEKKKTDRNELLEERADLISKLESRLVAYNALAKRLKEMQSEQDRLVSENVSLEGRLNQAVNNSKSLETKIQDQLMSLAILETRSNEYKQKNEVLEQKIASVLSPVGATHTPANTVKPVEKKNTLKVVAKEVGSSQVGSDASSLAEIDASSANALAFEEIKAPVRLIRKLSPEKTNSSKNKASASDDSGSFDYDKIAIH